MKGRDRYRRCRVATDRFQDLNLGFHSDFPHLLRDEKPVIVVRNDDRITGAVDTLKPQHRVLKQGPLGNKRQELLRQKSPRHVPEATVRFTRQDYWKKQGFHFSWHRRKSLIYDRHPI